MPKNGHKWKFTSISFAWNQVIIKMGIFPSPISFEFQDFFCDFENGGYVQGDTKKSVTTKMFTKDAKIIG